jgi:DNA-binding MarR family transcriptional regulator
MGRMKAPSRHPRSTAFLLAQVGAHAAASFAERLSVLDLTPAHAGTLRIIQGNSGISQQALSAVLGVPPSRLVLLVDELEERGLVERRDSPDDRRAHALYLTRKGTERFEAIGKIARVHDDAICSSLTSEEREMLGTLLVRIADEQGLTPGVHPGFSRLGRAPSSDEAEEKPRRRRRVPS